MRRIVVLVAALVIGAWLIMMQLTRQRDDPNSGASGDEGRPAPSFQLQDLSGQRVSLDDFKGKVVMLDFWATWCGPCRLTMPLLEKLQQEHPNDFTLLAVDVGEPLDEVAPYVRDRNIQARVLLDLNKRVGSAYGSDSIPMQVLIDKEGIIRHIQVGYAPSMKEDLWAEIRKLQ